jgi:DNA modification methylase
MEYTEFLRKKMAVSKKSGFDVAENEINPMLFPHQRDIVQWAAQGGRRAIFAAFGLGKSFMQLELMRLCGEREGGRQLIICPLGIRQEFRQDAAKLGIAITFIRRDEELGGDGLYITNYESVRDGRLNIELFNAVSLDEASVLRSYGSKTFQSFLQMFAGVKYRFVATATPSPNRYKELIHYAGFLGVMDTGQALTRFFQRDTQKANNLTLYPHMENEFWAWLGSWAVFVQKPSDLGHDDSGYELPRLHVHYHKVQSKTGFTKAKNGQMQMFPSAAMSLQDASREKRNSLPYRIDEMRNIIDQNPDDHCIIWHDQEKERHAIKRALPEAVEVYGSQDLDLREERIIGFSKGKFKYLATKPVLSGSGCNFQRHCNRAIFLGIGFKFNDFIQAVHRIYRFLQDKECHIHIIYAETESMILQTLLNKWQAHDEMVTRMTELIKEHGLNNKGMIEELKRSIGVKRIAATGKHFEVVNNDCVEETRRMDENSVGLVHTSIPFSNHYEYTPSYNDFGHTQDNAHFWKQMDYLTPELLRVLKPGRIFACHVKDRVLFGNTTKKGVPTISPFHAECIFHCQKHGFDYMGMITVVTDVVRENNQTYRLGWSEQCKDGSKMGVGSPEYVILMRKPQTDRTKGYADEPIKKTKDEYSRARWQVDAHAFWRSSGDRLMTAEEMSKLNPDAMCKAFTDRSLQRIYDYEEHVQIGEGLELRGALPARFMAIAPGSWHKDVWHDISRMRTLNGEQTRRGLNNHICPLQFDIIDRIITRYSNKDDLVYDPFGGIMSVPYRAIQMGRKAKGVELNHGYWLDGVKYARSAEQKVTAPSLFDLMKKQNQEVEHA